jgi:hypothetical protein
VDWETEKENQPFFLFWVYWYQENTATRRRLVIWGLGLLGTGRAFDPGKEPITNGGRGRTSFLGILVGNRNIKPSLMGQMIFSEKLDN